MVADWLEEDTPSFDYGGFVVGEEMAEARLLGKSEVSWFCLLLALLCEEQRGGRVLVKTGMKVRKGQCRFCYLAYGQKCP